MNQEINFPVINFGESLVSLTFSYEYSVDVTFARKS